MRVCARVSVCGRDSGRGFQVAVVTLLGCIVENNYAGSGAVADVQDDATVIFNGTHAGGNIAGACGAVSVEVRVRVCVCVCVCVRGYVWLGVCVALCVRPCVSNASHALPCFFAGLRPRGCVREQIHESPRSSRRRRPVPGTRNHCRAAQLVARGQLCRWLWRRGSSGIPQ